MEKLENNAHQTYYSIWAYIDGRKRKIGYARTTQGGGLCIRGDKIIDNTQLGKMLKNGIYLYADSAES